MKTKAVTLTLATALVLPILAGAATAAHGSWILGSGSFEPNTVWDTSTVMFQAPNTAASEKVYFNGVIMHYAGFVLGANYQPNVDGGSVMGTYANYAFAYLGFWRDCNRDGYVGARTVPHSLGSFSAYPRAGASIDETICPPGSVYNPTNVATNSPDGLIDEFRWIGPGAGCDSYLPGCPGTPGYTNPPKICVPPSNPNSPVCIQNRPDSLSYMDVTDNRSRVWGDWNFPGGAHIPSQGLNPLPRGTYHDSDGTLKYLDDATQGEISRAVGPAWSTKPNIGACDQPHPVFLGGPNSRLPVADRGTCGLYPLWQVYRLYNDSTCLNEDPSRGRPAGCSRADPLVKVFDTETESGNQANNPCDDAFRSEALVGVPTVGRVIGVPNPDVQVNPNFLADGSLQGTINNVWAAGNASVISTGGRCANPGSAPGSNANQCTALTQLECDAQTSDTVHRKPDFRFNYTAGTVIHQGASLGFLSIPRDNLGIGSVTTSAASPGWFSGNTWSNRPPRTGWGYTTQAFASFYADVTAEAAARAGFGTTLASALPGGADDKWTYGSFQCPTITTGGSNINAPIKWECSRTEWEDERRQNGGAFDPVLGDKYDLRDVDCFDNTVAEKVNVAGTWVDLSDVKAGIANCATWHQ